MNMKKDLKTKIVDTAEQLFNNSNYYAVSIRDIAKEAGVNHSTILYYFKNKENLYLTILENYIDKLKNKKGDWIELVINFNEKKYNKQESFKYLCKILEVLLDNVFSIDLSFKHETIIFKKKLIKLQSVKELIYKKFEEPIHDGLIKIILNIIDVKNVDNVKLHFLPSIIIGFVWNVVANKDIILRKIKYENLNDDLKKVIFSLIVEQTKLILTTCDKNVEI